MCLKSLDYFFLNAIHTDRKKAKGGRLIVVIHRTGHKNSLLFQCSFKIWKQNIEIK